MKTNAGLICLAWVSFFIAGCHNMSNKQNNSFSYYSTLKLPPSAERRLIESNSAYIRVIDIQCLWYENRSDCEMIGVSLSMRSAGGRYHASFLFRKQHREADWSTCDLYRLTSRTVLDIWKLSGYLPWEEISPHVTSAEELAKQRRRAIQEGKGTLIYTIDNNGKVTFPKGVQGD